MSEQADRTLELYKTLLEDVRDVRQARRGVSTSFLTINIAGIGALGVLAGLQSAGIEHANVLLLGPCVIALILTCFIWMNSNVYYDRKIATKFKTIYKIEDKLEGPVRPMREEYAARKRTKRDKQAEKGVEATQEADPDDDRETKKDADRSFTLEHAMPRLFIVGYIIFTVIVVYTVFAAKVDLLAAVGDFAELIRRIFTQSQN